VGEASSGRRCTIAATSPTSRPCAANSTAPDERAGEIRRRWHPSLGTGLADAFVAATAVELGAGLASFNEKHYPMIEVIVPYRRG
jgi:hypothetical protein